MDNINEKIKVLINEEKINNRIEELAMQIEQDYKNKEIVMVCILKGAAYFAVDLSKKIKNNIIMEFMKVSSYGNAKESSGNIEFALDISESVKGKDIIIVEDIIDTGNTLNYLTDYLKKKEPNSIKICVLLDKKSRRKIDVPVDYVGFEIEDKFVLGYGLDYEGGYRNIPYIGYVE